LSDTTASLRRKIDSAGDLQSVVRTMNAMAASNIGRADKNIDELLEDLNGAFHRLRQSGIDEELFDVISGFEALSVEQK
jgi:F0F1-type ATP synthase gamma subunit